MRVLIIILILSLAGCAATTASERRGQFAENAVLDIMTGILGLATGDPMGAGFAFGSAGINMGLSALEAHSSGSSPIEQQSSPDH